MDEKSDYVDKKFGFTTLIWEVKNFCISKDSETWRIYSPDLEVKGFRLAKWRMILMRNFVKDDQYVVEFRLKRLRGGDFSEKVSVECILVFSDRYGEPIEHDFKHSFDVNEEFDKTLEQAGFTPINDIHTDVFVLKVEILVYVSGINETIQSCENIGIKRLSDDFLTLYDSKECHDLKLQPEQHVVYAHRAILYHRIKNKEFRNKIISNVPAISVDDFLNEHVDRVVRFLYTGNIQHAVILPSIGVFRFARLLDVKPIVAYYNPDEITFTTSFDVEEYLVSWRLDDFLNLSENIVSSPLMTNNMMNAKWCLKVYPQGLSKRENMIGLYFDIQTETPMKICVDFFLTKDGDGERISYKSHKLIDGKEVFGDKNFIELDKAKAGYLSNGSLTVGLHLRIGSGNDDFSVGKSIANNQCFSGQKNYYSLSEDILSLYDSRRFPGMVIDFKKHKTEFYVHECILCERCSSLLDAFKTNNLTYFDNVKAVVIKELLRFVYSGQLNEDILLEDIFCLYDVANNFDFIVLSTVVIERLKESLTDFSSAVTILEFANAKNIEDLKDSALNYIKLNNLDN